MQRILCCLLFSAFALSAADVSGKWSGSIDTPDGKQPAYLELRRNGEDLSGTAGPAAETQRPIQKGKIQGKKLGFEVKMPNGGLMKFDLTFDGDRIEGDMWMEKDGDKEEPARLSVTRVS